MALKTHLAMDVMRRQWTSGNESVVVPVTELLCERDYKEAHRQGLVEINSEFVTCKRCIEVLAVAMKELGNEMYAMHKVMHEERMAVVVVGDRGVKQAREYWKERVRDAVRLYRSAAEDAERALARVDSVGDRTKEYRTAADIAHDVNRLAVGISNNIRTELLFGYGAELDGQIERARRRPSDDGRDAGGQAQEAPAGRAGRVPRHRRRVPGRGRGRGRADGRRVRAVAAAPGLGQRPPGRRHPARSGRRPRVHEMMFKVVLQKPVPGKSEPKESALVRNRRVVIVDSEGLWPWKGTGSQVEAKVINYVRNSEELTAGTTGEIVSIERVYPRFVVLAP